MLQQYDNAGNGTFRFEHAPASIKLLFRCSCFNALGLQILQQNRVLESLLLRKTTMVCIKKKVHWSEKSDHSCVLSFTFTWCRGFMTRGQRYIYKFQTLSIRTICARRAFKNDSKHSASIQCFSTIVRKKYSIHSGSPHMRTDHKNTQMYEYFCNTTTLLKH